MSRRRLVVITIAGLTAAAGLASTKPVAAAGPEVPVQSTCIECCAGEAVCQALAGLADLRASVDELVPDAGIANSLDVKIDATTASVLDSRITPAIDQLDAFGHEVVALESAGQLSTASSNVLKAMHDTVKNSISNIRG